MTLKDIGNFFQREVLDKTSIDEQVKSKVNQLRQSGQKFLNQPVPTKLQPVARGLEKVYNTQNPAISTPMQFGAGLLQGQSLGLGQNPYRTPQTTPEKIAYGAGTIAGSFNPKSLTGKTIGAVTKITNPVIAKTLKSVASPVAARIGAGIGNVAQGEIIGRSMGGQTNAGRALDFATGVAFGPNQFRTIGKSLDNVKVSKPQVVIHPDDIKEITNARAYLEKLSPNKRIQDSEGVVKNLDQTLNHYLQQAGHKLSTLRKMTQEQKYQALLPLIKQNVEYRTGVETPIKMGIVGESKATQSKPPVIKIKPQAETPRPAPQIVPETSAASPQSPLQTGPTPQPQIKQPQTPGGGSTGSLDDIIRSSSIPVTEKVGILDYLRTPDRVLRKIGLGDEAKHIREKYDDYLKELPVEIDRITNWSKQVPPESNQRIFKYLDGQPITLTPQEAKVAGEIRTYLQGWADRLGLPAEKRISNYITHIFEKDFIQKEFDPEIAKLIRDRVPGSVYDPFVEQRLGKMGYVEDTWRALDAYVKRATRKVNMDVALEQVKNKAQNLEESQFDYVKSYIDRINLRPTKLDNMVDNSIKQIVGYRFGQRPTAYLTKAGRQAVYRGTLGLNFGSALRNLSQGANTYAKLGEKYTAKGYVDLLKNGTKELEDVGVLRDDLIQDRTLSAGKQLLQKMDKGLFFFFETAEKINRGSAYYGAKAKALSEGLNEAQAIEYAKNLVRDTQFTFGSVDTPVALQSDIVKLLTQFQSFTLKQGEFLGEMAAKKDIAGLVRYGLASMAFVYGAGKLIGMEPKDIIPSLRIGLPPTLKAPVEIGKALMGAPDKYGNIPDTGERIENVANTAIPFIPAGVQAKKTIQGLNAVGNEGSFSRSGLLQYPIEQTPSNYIRAGLFGKNNLPEAQNYFDNNIRVLSKEQTERYKSSTNKQQTYEDIMSERQQRKMGIKIKKETPKKSTTKKKSTSSGTKKAKAPAKISIKRTPAPKLTSTIKIGSRKPKAVSLKSIKLVKPKIAKSRAYTIKA